MGNETRPDVEAARAQMRVVGPPPVQDVTRWDKEPPTESPTPKKIPIPKHLNKIVDFFQGIIHSEALLIDLCLERCMDIVERNVTSKMVGIDHFAGEGQGGAGPFTPVNFAAIAGPLTVELYKQALKAIESREAEYQALYAEMQEELKKNGASKSSIVLPS